MKRRSTKKRVSIKKRRGGKSKNTIARSRDSSGNSQGNNAPTRTRIGNPKSDLRVFTPVFAARARRKLTYFDSFVLTGTSGIWSQYVFSANGLYDPNISGTGHQPLGFDIMMLLYEQYTVLRSSIHVTAVGNGTQPARVVLALAPDTTTLVFGDTMENGLLATSVIDGRGNGGYGTGQRVKELTLKCDVAKYFGRKGLQSILNDTNLFGNAAGNPPEQVYFVVGAAGFGTLTDNTSVVCDVMLEFDAVFWEPRKLAANGVLRDHMTEWLEVVRPCHPVRVGTVESKIRTSTPSDCDDWETTENFRVGFYERGRPAARPVLQSNPETTKPKVDACLHCTQGPKLPV